MNVITVRDNIIHNSTKEKHESQNNSIAISVFGFWIYILQDLFIFATLFANFIIFSAAYDKGPSGKEFINLPFILVETFVLLFSSMTYGVAMVRMHQNFLWKTQKWLAITFLLGMIFIAMEFYEFTHLIYNGVTPSVSAYWSAFFTLIATHGIHVVAGLIWILCMFGHLVYSGLNIDNKTRLTCLSLFWHFLDIIWIGVFTIVYLMGVL